MIKDMIRTQVKILVTNFELNSLLRILRKLTNRPPLIRSMEFIPCGMKLIVNWLNILDGSSVKAIKLSAKQVN